MSAFCFDVDSKADLHRAIGFYGRVAPHRVPLIQALYDGRIAHMEVTRSGWARKLKAFMAIVKGPAVVLIGDDDDAPTGPQGWPIAARLLPWAKVVFLHAAGGERKHYEMAVNAAQDRGRVAFVETSSDHLLAWIAVIQMLAPRALVVLVSCKGGEEHPAPSAPEVRH